MTRTGVRTGLQLLGHGDMQGFDSSSPAILFNMRIPSLNPPGNISSELKHKSSDFTRKHLLAINPLIMVGEAPGLERQCWLRNPMSHNFKAYKAASTMTPAGLTCNPRLRRPMPYPLGHGASDVKNKVEDPSANRHPMGRSMETSQDGCDMTTL